MDLDFTPEEERFQSELRAWLKANVPARGRGGTREAPGGERLRRMKAWQRRLHGAGYVAIGWPAEYGGRGASLMEQTILGEELARARAPGLIGTMGIQMVGPTLMRWGSEEQKRRLLPASSPRTTSGARATRSPARAATSPRSRRAPCATATTSW